MTTRSDAAEKERRVLVNQAINQHLSRLASENKRFAEEVAHINRVCDSRTAAETGL